MKLDATPLAGLFVATSTPREDARGSFMRLFCADALQNAFAPRHIVQINHSRTQRVGAVRGLHYQRPPHAEMKLVRCLRGRAFDVAVDVRQDSATFLHWYAVELSPDNCRMMVIPEGFAHGFQALEPETELLYLHTAFYEPAAEAALHHADPALSIHWPLPITDVSDRDMSHPMITPTFKGVQP